MVLLPPASKTKGFPMVFLPLALQTKGLVAGWLEIRTLSGLPKHTISLLNSLSNRSIWEPWPPDAELAGLMGWQLAAKQLAGNPDSGLPTAAQGKRGGRRFCCLGGGMREGVLFMSSNVLLVPIQ